jgi:hypothetical protein
MKTLDPRHQFDPRRELLVDMINAHTKTLRRLPHADMLPIAERLVSYLKELDAHSQQTKEPEPTP